MSRRTSWRKPALREVRNFLLWMMLLAVMILAALYRIPAIPPLKGE